jgi:transposase InsO family protein
MPGRDGTCSSTVPCSRSACGGDGAGPIATSRGSGWEYVHVCIDDASRLAFSQILPDEKSAVAFLKAAVAYHQSLGITVARVMTDNGSCYRAKAFGDACRDLGILTRPYSPRTNGKAKRFIQTALREWAYATAYPTSDHRGRRAAALAPPLQLASPPRQPKLQATNQPPRPRRGQPIEAPQLAVPLCRIAEEFGMAATGGQVQP